VKKMIADIDKDGSGTIDFEDFLAMMTTKMGERDSREEILKAFRLFDDDETGKISFKNLKRVAKELGENMTDEELQEMIDEADRDGDGEVNGAARSTRGCFYRADACFSARGGVHQDNAVRATAGWWPAAAPGPGR